MTFPLSNRRLEASKISKNHPTSEVRDVSHASGSGSKGKGSQSLAIHKGQINSNMKGNNNNNQQYIRRSFFKTVEISGNNEKKY